MGTTLHKYHAKNFQLRVEKLDHRHRGKAHFEYRIWINGPQAERLSSFIEIRKWCWDTWGAACEREIHTAVKSLDIKADVNPHWAFHAEKDASYGNLYIYLSGNQELTLFKLKWM